MSMIRITTILEALARAENSRLFLERTMLLINI